MLRTLSHGVGSFISWQPDADEERLSKAVIKMLERKIDEKKLDIAASYAFSILSTSLEDSIIRKEEKELLRISLRFRKDRNIVQIMKNKDIDAINLQIKNNPHIMKLLLDHINKWEFLGFGYKGPPYSREYFIGRLIELFPDADKMLKEYSVRDREMKRLHEELRQKLGLGRKEIGQVKTLQRTMSVKDYRKGALYYAMYSLEPFFKRVAKRLKLTINDVWMMASWEVEGLLLNRKEITSYLTKEHIAKRKEALLMRCTRDKLDIFVGDEANEYIRRLPKEKIETDCLELKGTIASPGFARGIVKIIEVVEDIPKMNTGDILISETTYPSLMPAMTKAAAIVTNAGGVTCHAAIVSRELGVPCLVGTKKANKVFKDGDLVEVDADKGFIRKLTKYIQKSTNVK